VFAQRTLTDGPHDRLLCSIVGILPLFLGEGFDLGEHLRISLRFQPALDNLMHALMGDDKLFGDCFECIATLIAFDDLLVAFRFGDVFVYYGGLRRVLECIKPLQDARNGFF